ncbi:MAG: DNA repair protein RecN [bacterium]|nr:DNA repair protein RecN [bacterium]
MLREISVKGFDIIDNINVNFSSGLNIITGETGAGKSLIVEAIQQLLGARASSSMVKSGYSKAQIVGVFDLPEKEELIRFLEDNGIEVGDEIIILKEITNTGKSSLRVNGTVVPASVVREIGKYLVNIFSQLENSEVLSPEYQLNIIDSFGRLFELRKSFSDIFLEWKSLKEKKAEIESRIQNRFQELDFLNYQIDELKRANLLENEDEILKEEEGKLLNIERLRQDVEESYMLLYEDDDSVVSRLSKASQLLIGLESIDNQLGSLGREIENQEILISELCRTLRSYISKLREIDSSALEELEARLHFLNDLKRKYRVKSVNELIETLKNLEVRKEELEKIEEESGNLDSLIESTYIRLREIGKTLSDKRIDTAKRLSRYLEGELRELGMPNVRIELVVEEIEEPISTGFDSVTFLIATVPDEPLKRIEDVVSGGELSRISLAIKSLLRDVELFPTLIFDEIDIGIGGKTAIAVGEKIYELSKKTQVINITHLPQVAVFADTHMCVQKTLDDIGKVDIEIKVLEDEERVMEISRMLTGQIMESTVINAKELISYAEKLKEGIISEV